MPSYSIGEALSQLLDKSGWAPKVHEMRLHQEWETIVGATIAKYTRNVKLKDGILSLYTDIAPLKQELLYGKPQLIEKINKYFGEPVVKDITIK